MIYVISKATFGSYNVHDIQCNANWTSCPYSDYARIPDHLVEHILATNGYCNITLNNDGTEVAAFTARHIPSVPEECCGTNTVLSVNGAKADSAGNVSIDFDSVGAAPESHLSDKNNPHGVTKSQVGLGNVPNVTTNNQVPTYTQASSLANLVSGEKLSVSLGKIMKAIADLISHLANKSNPHGVTASQVGAFPNTGGRITGAVYLSNNYDNGSSAVYKNNSATADHGLVLLDQTASGDTARLILNRSTGKAEVTLDNGATYEDIMLANYNTTYHAWSKNVGGVTQWLNPPMVLGTEYCTTEHYQGKQVYTKVFDGGAMADGAEIDYPNIAADTISVIDSRCTVGRTPIPQRADGTWGTADAKSIYFACYMVKENLIRINCGTGMVGSRVYVQIWYTRG